MIVKYIPTVDTTATKTLALMPEQNLVMIRKVHSKIERYPEVS